MEVQSLSSTLLTLVQGVQNIILLKFEVVCRTFVVIEMILFSIFVATQIGSPMTSYVYNTTLGKVVSRTYYNSKET